MNELKQKIMLAIFIVAGIAAFKLIFVGARQLFF